MKHRALALLVILVLAGSGHSSTSRTPSIDQSLSFKSVQGPRISPDGRWVAFQVQETNWEENEFKTEIWVADTSTGNRFQLTSGKKSSNSPQWSPDSKRIAFASDRDGKRQLYLISPTGGEAAQLTSSETGVGAFQWSPDGSRIAFTSGDPESKEMKARKEKYGDFVVVKGDYTMMHLWIIEVPADSKTGRPEPARLTDGLSFTVGQFSWAPDSKSLAFSGARDPDLESSDTSDIYVLNVATKAVRKLVDTPGPDTNPVWSPKGDRIAYQTANGEQFFYYMNSRIAVVNSEGGTPEVLKLTVDEAPSLMAWGPEGLYLSILDRSYAHTWIVNPATGRAERLTTPARFFHSQASFSSDFSRMAFIGAGDNECLEVFAAAVKPFSPKRLTESSAQFKEFTLARRELIEWRSTDGTPIEGVLIKPADFDPGRKYPLLVIIHGGPTGVDRTVLAPDRYYPQELFAAKGALILRPNYRGSAGYGEKFRSLNVRNLGVGDYWDVISGVDHLIAQGIVDPDRVGAMGWSQGGYISAFITASSDRFKAVSVGAGISNWMTYYVNTDIPPFTRQYLKATPWDDPDIYAKTSPMTYIKKAKTPTLIQHGEFDRRVPIPNAYELRRALEDIGVPVKMIVYKGFGHGINKPRQHRAVMEHNYEWFSRWIWGESPVDPAK